MPSASRGSADEQSCSICGQAERVEEWGPLAEEMRHRAGRYGLWVVTRAGGQSAADAAFRSLGTELSPSNGIDQARAVLTWPRR